MLDVKWRCLIDSEVRVAFAVAPWTGSLFAQPLTEREDWSPPRLLGFDPRQRGDVPDFAREDMIIDPQPHIVGRLDRVSAVAAQRSRVINRLVFRIPIALLIALAAFDAQRFQKRDCWPRIDDPLEACAYAAALFGTRSGGNCLPMSISRFWFLRSIGQDARVHIGVFVPTDTMHAWVQIAGRAVLESADELVHYQSSVVYGRAR